VRRKDAVDSVRPSRRLEAPTRGTLLLGLVVVGNLLLWILLRPDGQPWGRFAGEIVGAEAVLLFSCSLVLATLLPVVERAFDGLDRVARWHRYTAVVGVVLMIGHPTLAGLTPVPDVSQVGLKVGSLAMFGLVLLSIWALAPSLKAARWSRLIRYLVSLSHERWLTGHRLTGLFVIAAVVHGAMVDPVLTQSRTLKVSYLLIGSVGIVAYIYRELFARYVVPIYDYVVAEVQRPNDITIDVFLEPDGKALAFEPGQFIFLAFGGTNGWERHPFTVASAPSQGRLEVSIRALGDYTRDLRENLQPGTPAKVAGPFGAFDFRRGGQQQIWIAGGAGITPFISWIRALPDDFDREVAFYYSVNHAAEALYLDEITAADAAHPTLRTHLVDSSVDGYLTADLAVTDVADPAASSVFMCGPPSMMTAMSDGFQHLGIPRSQIRWEQFSVR
jgi:predicted ferric reductase